MEAKKKAQVKRKKKPTKPLTAKQRKVLELVAENDGKTKGEIIKEAGYSKEMQDNPQRVFGSKAIIQAMEDAGLTDDYLLKKHKEHLNARKIEVKDFFSYTWEDYDVNPEHVTEEIGYELERDMPGAKVVTIRKAGSDRNQYLSVRFSVPDYAVQDRSLDKAYKIKGSYAPEKHDHNVNISLLSLFKKQ